MSSSNDRSAAFLAAADQLERWAEGLPRWRKDSNEPWWEFLDRRYAAETRLIEGLRKAPQCQIDICPARLRVELTIEGQRVSTNEGLAAALLAWAKLVRAPMGG